MQCLVKRFGEKFNDLLAANFYCIYIIGPINEQPTPNHYTQHRKIDPVKPADCQRMLLYNFPHKKALEDLTKVTIFRSLFIMKQPVLFEPAACLHIRNTG